MKKLLLFLLLATRCNASGLEFACPDDQATQEVVPYPASFEVNLTVDEARNLRTAAIHQAEIVRAFQDGTLRSFAVAVCLRNKLPTDNLIKDLQEYIVQHQNEVKIFLNLANCSARYKVEQSRLPTECLDALAQTYKMVDLPQWACTICCIAQLNLWCDFPVSSEWLDRAAQLQPIVFDLTYNPLTPKNCYKLLIGANISLANDLKLYSACYKNVESLFVRRPELKLDIFMHDYVYCQAPKNGQFNYLIESNASAQSLIREKRVLASMCCTIS